MTQIGINSNIPAEILSNRSRCGGPTSTVFLQAVGRRAASSPSRRARPS